MTTARAAALTLAGLAACTPTPTASRADARSVPTRDGVPLDQCDAPTVQLGRCELSGTGEACMGVPDETRRFVALETGEPIDMILGPQGSLMFVLALRTHDIIPGDPNNPASADNPDVDILLTGRGHEVARYRGHPAFVPATHDATVLEAAGLFVVVDTDPDVLVNHPLVATAHIVDRNGTWQCGQVMFVAAR